ncbi:hypothetical protein J6590_083750 [Homalodisca vitripennis]|nr:hypothetical protein J6590_083750 [Homalodisca vitripennis]
MWTIIVLATAILTTATALENVVPYQYSYSYPQDYMSSATYNGWRTPTKGSSKSFQHRLLETFSSLCPDCLKDDGVDEVTEIPILKDAIEYTYFHIIKPIIKVLVHNFGIDKEVIYTSTVSVCDRNERDMDTMELANFLVESVEMFQGQKAQVIFCYSSDRSTNGGSEHFTFYSEYFELKIGLEVTSPTE